MGYMQYYENRNGVVNFVGEGRKKDKELKKVSDMNRHLN